MKRFFCILFALALLLSSCGGTRQSAPETTEAQDWNRLSPTGSLNLTYAQEYSVTDYGVYSLITIGADRFLLVPEGANVPAGLPDNITVLQQPLDRIYLAATSAMDLYRAAGCMDAIRLSSLEESGWYIAEARQAMAAGKILYAGKYSAPDYERIYAEGCNLAIESTMITHSPEVKEQLNRLGIPVLVERSSYETHPLGRMEWMKLHGVLTGRRQEAVDAFEKAVAGAEAVMGQTPTGKTVAFFSVSTTGMVTVRKASDYVAHTIALAGGKYLFDDLQDDTATSTMNMQMEAFFDRARDADVLIYNSTTAGELQTLDDLFRQSDLFRQFAAVQTGKVYCTGKNLFQETTALGSLISEIHEILTEEAPENLQYLHVLK